MKGAYYNEIDPFAAAWLRELIGGGHIAPGEVDERSIKDVNDDDLKGYSQHHFFAGIGGWSRALRLAGWDDARSVWTGSCPCQPFSVIGRHKNEADERHLWPNFRDLIAQHKPAIVFGEQVASADGRLWLGGVRTDLEALGYEVGAADLCAAGIALPHIRQRLYWVGHTIEQGLEGHAGDGDAGRQPGWHSAQSHGSAPASGRDVHLTDGSRRRIALQPALFPMADGVPNRMGLLRGAGNAVVPPLAAEFVMAAMEAMQC